MYESHFLLSKRPFTPVPDAEVYLPTKPLEQARQTLVRCIERAEGPGLIIGPAGTGKSLLCHILASHFRGRFQVAQLAGARLSTRRALLQSILFELKLPYRDMDEGELRLSLIDHLEPRSGGSEGLLLLADEAHSLPQRLLEEIRLLTNIVRDGQSRVRLVLAGGMALEEKLTSPRMEAFHQRIAARCYLQPLGRDETIYYVQEQLRRCSGSADSLFTVEAQAAVHTASDGIPRLINQLCDHALMLAALGGHRQLDAAGIEEAWADLQQLPVPISEPPTVAAKTGGIVEFGQLGDDRPAVAGTIGPSAAEAAVEKLDSISQTLNMLTQESAAGLVTGTAADDFSPAAAGGTEVELFFHGAHDPFGEHWEEEEVVIDPYASLQDTALRGRRVTSDEGRAIGAAVSAAAGIAAEANSPPAEEKQAMHAVVFDPASDPLLPEEADEQAPAPRSAVTLRAIGQDDRDMIVVDEEPPAKAAQRTTPPAGRTKRPEYRQLFSSLRKK
jgi:type II secretory pathway predicted ATPase ExeA